MALTVWEPFDHIKTKVDMVRYMEAVIEEVKSYRDEDLEFFYNEFDELHKLAKEKGWIK